MHPALLLKGLFIGLSIAAPVGPIGILCIRRTLKGGFRAGIVTGMGAATADAAYGGVAAFGITSVSNFLLRHQSWLTLWGGVLLCYLGARTFLSRPATAPAPAPIGRLFEAYGSTLLLTLANPATILSFAVVFAALGLAPSVSYISAGGIVLGVFIGSALWWFLLSAVVSLGRSRIDAPWMRMINFVSGAVLFALGLFSIQRT